MLIQRRSCHGYSESGAFVAASYLATISSVSSVEPSLTITQRSGGCVCAIIDLIVNSMNCASFRAGVTRTYFKVSGIFLVLL